MAETPAIRGGVSWASLSALIGLTATGVYLVYQATHTNTTNTAYAKGADHVETTVTISPTYNAYPLSIPPMCGKIFSFDSSLLPKPAVKK